MPKWSKEVLEAVKTAAVNNREDVEAATTEALAAIKGLAEYKQIIGDLIKEAVAGLVYEARHRTNVQIKKETGMYGGPAKVQTTTSVAVARACESVYHYCIAGTTIGHVLGKDLIKLASKEAKTAEGHLFNVRLLSKLSTLVPAEAVVMQAVSEDRLKAVFFEVQKAISDEAAA